MAKFGEDPIVHIKRNSDFTYTFGIRAHKEFGLGLGFRSIIVPWHNEWLPFFFYFIFMLYFWIEVLLVAARAKQYVLRRERDWDYMFLATFGIALSLSCTMGYLLFYPMS